MTTSTSLAPSQERDGHTLLVPASQPPPAAALAAADRTLLTHERHAFAQETQWSRAAQLRALTVSRRETGPHSPSELVLVASQPPPAVINRPQGHAASPRGNHPAPLSAFVACTMGACTPSSHISVTCIIAYHGADGARLDPPTGCQSHQWWTTAVQETLRGYKGPSALVCWRLLYLSLHCTPVCVCIIHVCLHV